MLIDKLNKRNKDSFSCSDVSDKTSPPWCSSRKVCQRKKLIGAQSTYQLRATMWQYLYESTDENFNRDTKIGNRDMCKHKERRNYKGRKTKLILLMFLGFGFVGYLYQTNQMPCTDAPFIYSLVTKKLLDFGKWKQSSVCEECCHKMKYLSLELSRAEHILRHRLRVRSNVLTARFNSVTELNRTALDKLYIEGCTTTKGETTVEWGGRVALWGLVPLWRAASPPHTVLARRGPTPADCWAFSGNTGVLIIELPRSQPVASVSVEHVTPDTANSAPKHFIVYGISINSTTLKLIESEYKHSGASKQYYFIHNKAHFRTIIFKVLSNHGNTKYTCVYRVHLYGSANNVRYKLI